MVIPVGLKRSLLSSLEKFQGDVEVPFHFGHRPNSQKSLQQKVANTIVPLLASQSSALGIQSIEHLKQEKVEVERSG